MPVRKVKPTTNGQRQLSHQDFSDITKTSPEKSLVIIKKQHAGRNNQGKITVRHQGGGAKRFVRIIDFKRDKFNVKGLVASIEYDPNRGPRIALINYQDGEKRYIIAPIGLKVGDDVMSSKELIEIKTGNAMPAAFIPAGMAVHSIELVPGGGAKICRGAGNAAYVMSVEKKFAQIKLPSGEIRLIKKECLVTVGQVGNADLRHLSIGKAGRSRHLGIRPTVRGTAMNPVDHPHGGGEGNQPIGLKHPKTKWGKNAYGVHTRRAKRASTRLIVTRRKK
ncbi:50S ribosomal protein L2 [Candidatus Falkowbacteria bacterium CG10_big_fil_rev_8_21_14_0_10_37_14]|uniref:Large ribosomal subunit protein uL2 n=1 Tax=Candidatus Falkowbacteria bacterium CG10_big_fil_rev_8_21_14_0_10_37_14 TaxID=1974561 RepID=A0A2M6WTX1_9BACT|nr:50S ribosomal protein L2 [Candidatus Falkowbacteria bacterium]PIT96245.1 MAG: 50S ribosomal protein L2 [Candidatus Falkowbacteria bacterium CG10_big_fil_rev_8_21_14_0_10_37_14]